MEAPRRLGSAAGRLGDWCVGAGLEPAEKSAGARSRKLRSVQDQGSQEVVRLEGGSDVWTSPLRSTASRRSEGLPARTPARQVMGGPGSAPPVGVRKWRSGVGPRDTIRRPAPGRIRVGFAPPSLGVVGAVSNRVDRTRRGCRVRFLGRAAGVESPRWREGAACVGRGLLVVGVRAVGCGMWTFFGPRVRSRHGEEAPAFAPGAEGFGGRGYAS